jgi:hypothetical protein
MINTSVETITPGLAKSYLQYRNAGNRNVSAASVKKYADDMRSGRWRLTGQPIVFDTDGRLVDGHHRLTAAAEHHLTFQSLVVRGVQPETVEAFDLVRPRTASDVAHMGGVQNARSACSVANLILIHERHGIQCMKFSARHPTKIEVSTAAATYPHIQLAVAKARKIGRWLAPAVAGFCYWAMHQVDPASADSFFHQLDTGEGLTPKSPVLHMRNRLIDNKNSRAKLDNVYLTALMFKAFNYYRQEKPMSDLRWRQNGDFPEAFPELEK